MLSFIQKLKTSTWYMFLLNSNIIQTVLFPKKFKN